MLEPLLQALPAVAGLPGRPRTWPDKLHADKGNDYAKCRALLSQRGIQARIARRGVEPRERLGRHSWFVARTLAWLSGFGKLRIRLERSMETHIALLKLACSTICASAVESYCKPPLVIEEKSRQKRLARTT